MSVTVQEKNTAQSVKYSHPAANCRSARKLFSVVMEVSPLMNNVRPTQLARLLREAKRDYECQKALWNYKEHIKKCDTCREGLHGNKDMLQVQADVTAD